MTKSPDEVEADLQQVESRSVVILLDLLTDLVDVEEDHHHHGEDHRLQTFPVLFATHIQEPEV